MDILVLFYFVGMIAGMGLVALIWYLWWAEEKDRPLHCGGCSCGSEGPC